MRDRNQYRGYFRSVTALGRASAAFLALVLPVGILIFLIVPDPDIRFMFQQFIAATEGQTILLIAAVLEPVGLLWRALLLRRQDDF